jgi:hypothetical protein
VSASTLRARFPPTLNTLERLPAWLLLSHCTGTAAARDLRAARRTCAAAPGRRSATATLLLQLLFPQATLLLLQLQSWRLESTRALSH